MNKENLSKTLIKLRNQAGLTQKELAQYLNYSDKVISKWERGESVPDIYALEAIATFYKLSMDQLMDGEESIVDNRDKPYQLIFKCVQGPKLFVKLSILFPFIFWVFTPFLGIVLFIVWGFCLIVLTIIWGICISHSTWEAIHNEHAIRIVTSGTKCMLFMDQIKVDEEHSIFSNYLLSMKIQEDNIKIRVSQLFVKIHVFATVE